MVNVRKLEGVEDRSSGTWRRSSGATSSSESTRSAMRSGADGTLAADSPVDSHGGELRSHGVELVESDRALGGRGMPPNHPMDVALRDFNPRVVGSNPTRLTSIPRSERAWTSRRRRHPRLFDSHGDSHVERIESDTVAPVDGMEAAERTTEGGHDHLIVTRRLSSRDSRSSRERASRPRRVAGAEVTDGSAAATLTA
jgi:hypothetical protein